jgi:NAD(P)H-hydrate epimerase
MIAGGNELLTNEEMGRADKLAVAAGVPSLTLMDNAGRAVADEAEKMVSPGARIVVLAGPGNNGGDGFVAARLLKERGYNVRLCLLGERERLKGDAAAMAARWKGSTGDSRMLDLSTVDLIIDAIFGAGLSRPIDADSDEGDVIIRVNAMGDALPVLSVDVPSGLDGTTGMAPGLVFHATRTVTFFRKKPGHLLMPGRALCGDMDVADIGIPPRVLDEIAPAATINTADGWLPIFPWPTAGGHKYARGHAVVVSGPRHQTGAARLGARGALRIGAGLVTVASPLDAVAVNAAHLTAIMLKPFDRALGLAELLADERKNAVLIGPGCGCEPETSELVTTILASKAAVVVDADALTSFAGAAGVRKEVAFGFTPRSGGGSASSPERLFEAIRAKPDRAVALTPHEGEFKRLFGEVGGSKLDRARAAAVASGAIVILKGPDTVIAAPDGRAAINDNAPPWLATAGSGDVLAGFVTGLLAQGMPTFEAACAAVWLHGECANRFGPGLIAEDLPELLPAVLAGLAGQA